MHPADHYRGFPSSATKSPDLAFIATAPPNIFAKGLERQHLIGLAVAGFNNARTITNASAKGLDARQDDYNKGICSPGSLANNPVR